MQSMSVRPEQLSALAGQIRGGSQEIRNLLERLETEIGRLRSSWSGEAQQSYDQAQLRWNRNLSEMQTLLNQIAGKTDEISAQYQQTDRSAAGRFTV